MPASGSFIAGVAFVACLGAAAHADVWNEVGDAGGQNGIATAQVVVGVSPLTDITGVIGQALGGNDVDVYQILITDFQNFSATSSGPLDTMLWLFKADGTGQVMNDDFPGLPSAQLSKITNQGVFSNGVYYLAISRFNNRPLDVGGNQVFGNTLWPGPDPGQYQANPAAGAFTQWTGSTGATGGYKIFLTGAGSVPAPGAIAALGALMFVRPRRRE
jgi:hypothetical protein